MTNRSSSLLALSAAAFALACGGTPEPSTPEPVAVEAPQSQPAQTPAPAAAAAVAGTLTDERAMEIARGYVELLHAGNYAQVWEHVTPSAKERFGSLEQFQSEGERVMSDLGKEVGIVSEAVEQPRAGMQADKLYMRVSHYERSSGAPVRMMIGLKNDGSIVGIQVRPAQ